MPVPGSIVLGEGIGLFLYGLLTGFLFLFGSDLLSRYYSADKQTRGDPAYMVFWVIGSCVLGYGVYMLLATLEYFFEQKGLLLLIVRLFILTTQVGAFAIISESIIFTKARSIKVGNIKFGVFGFTTLIDLLYIFILAWVEYGAPGAIGDAYSAVFYPVYLLMAGLGLCGFFGFLIIVFKMLSPQKEIKKKILFGLIWIIIALVGGYFEGIYRDLWNELFIIGTIVEILGWLFLRHYFLSVPSYGELEWKSGLIEMHVIMAETGISLFNRTFRTINPAALKGDLNVQMTIPEEARPNTDLIGGGMIGIRGMLSEIAGTKGKLEQIQIGEKNLVFSQGENVLVLLLADKPLGVYHSILKTLVKEIESEHPGLATFNGDTRQLHIGPIVDKFFGAEKVKTDKTPDFVQKPAEE
jgi:hypothetical protein